MFRVNLKSLLEIYLFGDSSGSLLNSQSVVFVSGPSQYTRHLLIKHWSNTLGTSIHTNSAGSGKRPCLFTSPGRGINFLKLMDI